MGLGKYDGELKWPEVSSALIRTSGSMIEVMYAARELREDFRVVAGARSDAELATALEAPSEDAIADAREAVTVLQNLFKIFEGDNTVAIENFADKLRKFS